MNIRSGLIEYAWDYFKRKQSIVFYKEILFYVSPCLSQCSFTLMKKCPAVATGSNLQSRCHAKPLCAPQVNQQMASMSVGVGGAGSASGFSQTPSTTAGWPGSSSGQTLSTQLWKWVVGDAASRMNTWHSLLNASSSPVYSCTYNCFLSPPSLHIKNDLIDRVGLCWLILMW